mmetsp:Transcript_24004/g.77470  ORF Transcript_24004/g.77470 Transcript_24004/m.77470 type:complete len:208 (-) Transcript_24004:7756-8379(-)|eukprot:scaffold10814_cov112-Isochrysis_galbana.AAC.4
MHQRLERHVARQWCQAVLGPAAAVDERSAHLHATGPERGVPAVLGEGAEPGTCRGRRRLVGRRQAGGRRGEGVEQVERRARRGRVQPARAMGKRRIGPHQRRAIERAERSRGRGRVHVEDTADRRVGPVSRAEQRERRLGVGGVAAQPLDRELLGQPRPVGRLHALRRGEHQAGGAQLDERAGRQQAERRLGARDEVRAIGRRPVRL